MAHNDLITLYTERKKTFQARIETAKQKSASISWLRVAVAIGIAVLIYFSFQWVILWWVIGITLIAYFFLVSYYEKLTRERRLVENLELLNEAEIKSHQGDHSFFEDGYEFADGQHPYAVDLDIFGKGSVFQRLNRTCTEPGKEKLAHFLSHPLPSTQDIMQQQEAVKELSDRIDFRQIFWATGALTKEKKEDQKQLLDWLKSTPILYGKKFYPILLIAAPVLSMTTLIIGLYSGTYGAFILVSLMLWAVIGLHAKRVMLFQDYIGSKRFLLEKFAAHFELLHQQKFTSPVLAAINAQSHNAKEQLQILASRSKALDLRLNIFANLLFNTTVLYELQCVYRLEKWREKNKQHLPSWLQAVQDADALNSLASFKFNHPQFIFPQITDQQLFDAQELGHPLIPMEQSVTNTVSIDENSKVWIITGANMAGKSTFLRTIGVNTVLALTGSVVCAKKMVCPLISIYTGMRNTDSINENQSYFFAELLRLQKIMQELRSGKKLLVLLDEILKGTNSVDKLTGSQELVRKLIEYTSITMIATHDIALGDMEKEHPQRIKNYHFETFINGDELSFDYKLKPGVTTGKNATFLMKKMGIVD